MILTEYKGIDLSRHNIVQDWDKVKNQVDFVILRAGGNFDGFYKDSKFERYYDACKLRNIPVGAYYDAGKAFIGADTGKEYADHFRQLLSGHTFEYPVYVDIEVTPKKFKRLITAAAISFCDYMEDLRYFTGIYGGDISTFHDALIADDISAYTLWVARYGSKPKYIKQYGIWQHSSKGHIDGIIGNVDLDISYVNYPKIIKGVHLNGY